ncbi:MAG: hypothetical protein V1664_01075 [Candidatus Uhrbacteria bacterium]
MKEKIFKKRVLQWSPTSGLTKIGFYDVVKILGDGLLAKLPVLQKAPPLKQF